MDRREGTEISFNQALKIAEGIDDEGCRVEALAGVAAQLARAGCRGRAERLFEEVISYAKNIESSESSPDELRMLMKTLSEISSELAVAGYPEKAKQLLDQAIERAEGIEGDYERALRLGELVEPLVKAGHRHRGKQLLEEALELLRLDSTISVSGRVQALLSLSIQSMNAGFNAYANPLLLEALEAIKRPSKEAAFDFDMSSIVAEFARRGKLDKANKMTKQIRTHLIHSTAMQSIAVATAERGDLESAIKLAHRIEDEGRRSTAIVGIARIHAARGNRLEAEQLFEEAIRSAIGLSPSYSRSLRLHLIVDSLVKVGDLDRAIRVSEDISDALERDFALESTVRGLAEAGRIEDALEIADGIEDHYCHASSLKSVALEIAKRSAPG